MKEERKNNQLLNERREDQISNANELPKNNEPTPNPKDFEEIEY